MLKRFAALLLCLMFLPASFAMADSAASTVPEFITQVRKHTEKAEDPFTIMVSDSIVDNVIKGGGNLLSVIMHNLGVSTLSYTYEITGSTREVTFSEVVYYPGQKIAAAWRGGNISVLSDREQETLRKALTAAGGLTGGDLEKEKAIHDYLCSRITRVQNQSSMGENDTAVGALLNGYADCDGFADAFSLLCAIAGLETRRVVGSCTADGSSGSHMWNAVKINGKWCFVDVANDDQDLDQATYIYYNRGAEEIAATHSWRKDALDITVAGNLGNTLRSDDLKENYVSSWEELSETLYASVLTRPSRIGIYLSTGFSVYSNTERFQYAVYTSGIATLGYGQTGNMLELTDITYYDNFKRVSSEAEASEHLKACKRNGQSSITLICPDRLYQELMKNNGKKIFSLMKKAGISSRDVRFIEKYGLIFIQ